MTDTKTGPLLSVVQQVLKDVQSDKGPITLEEKVTPNPVTNPLIKVAVEHALVTPHTPYSPGDVKSNIDWVGPKLAVDPDGAVKRMQRLCSPEDFAKWKAAHDRREEVAAQLAQRNAELYAKSNASFKPLLGFDADNNALREPPSTGTFVVEYLDGRVVSSFKVEPPPAKLGFGARVARFFKKVFG